MCDTIVVTSEASKDGVMLFGKNSDREPNEAQYIFHSPAADHPPGSHVRCTYIEIPQVEHTHAILLSKPFWIWGAEMGVNEHGLAIGNEAVFTKIPYVKEGQLIGMDMLRLALERADSAQRAVHVITELLAEYGQGGNCGVMRKTYYHNSFLIADPQEAWVLESADRHWAAKRVRGVYTISNCLTIGNEWDLASPDLVQYAIERKWCKSPDDFDFSGCYSDFLYTTFSDSRTRHHRSTELLTQDKAGLTPQALFSVLRDHSEPLQTYRPDQGLLGADLCMHAGFGPYGSLKPPAPSSRIFRWRIKPTSSPGRQLPVLAFLNHCGWILPCLIWVLLRHQPMIPTPCFGAMNFYTEKPCGIIPTAFGFMQRSAMNSSVDSSNLLLPLPIVLLLKGTLSSLKHIPRQMRPKPSG